MEVRNIYFYGDYESYPGEIIMTKRAVLDPPHTGWGRVILVPRGEGRSVIIDPTSLSAFDVANDCEELIKSTSADNLSATIKRLCSNLVERDKLRLPISRLAVDSLKGAGVDLPEIQATAEQLTESPKAKEPKERKPSPREGLVPVAEIAEQLEISPKEARGALRRAKAEKPEHGWAWPQASVEAIKALIRENLK